MWTTFLYWVSWQLVLRGWWSWDYVPSELVVVVMRPFFEGWVGVWFCFGFLFFGGGERYLVLFRLFSKGDWGWCCPWWFSVPLVGVVHFVLSDIVVGCWFGRFAFCVSWYMRTVSVWCRVVLAIMCSVYGCSYWLSSFQGLHCWCCLLFPGDCRKCVIVLFWIVEFVMGLHFLGRFFGRLSAVCDFRFGFVSGTL